jgi:predicted NAD/FAD-binding protein
MSAPIGSLEGDPKRNAMRFLVRIWEFHDMLDNDRLKIAVVGTGISGISAAWLLSRQHNVTLYEQADRVGGHSNTVQVKMDGQTIPVDTGFIVFNRATYPNLTALFAHLKVGTQLSNMSFAASLDGGNFEYAGGSGIGGLFAQKSNIGRPRFLSMLSGIRKFYREAMRDSVDPRFKEMTLGDYLIAGGYSDAFRDDHLLPMASAIWSASPAEMLSFPALAFTRFHANHGLLQIGGRPLWETVTGGSISYVRRLLEDFSGRIKLDAAVLRVTRSACGVQIFDSQGGTERFDHVVMANHADQALAALENPTSDEVALLSAFRYQRNLAVLHSDTRFMPRRRAAWASWNYIGGRKSDRSDASFTYWMNRLQGIPDTAPLFVTLNPQCPPPPETLHHSESYDHPIFDAAALAAQSQLWGLQGARRTWFCGAYFGAGFHEDGLQAGLAVAEELGSLRRPWTVANESGRIVIKPRRREYAEPESIR